MVIGSSQVKKSKVRVKIGVSAFIFVSAYSFSEVQRPERQDPEVDGDANTRNPMWGSA